MGRVQSKKHHRVEHVDASGDVLILDIDGKRHVFNWSELSPKLAKATSQERRNLEITQSGYGIHWFDLDEDLSIDGLLGISHEPADCRGIA